MLSDVLDLRCALLLSGGIDSTVVAALLRQREYTIEALFVDYGQPAAAAERVAGKSVAAHYNFKLREVGIRGVVVPMIGEVPGRNDLLIAAAASMYPRWSIAVGTHSGTSYRDSSETHAHAWQALLDSQYDGAVRLIAPLLRLHKNDVFALANDMNVPTDLTYSCEAGTTPCRQCRSCADRKVLDARS